MLYKNATLSSLSIINITNGYTWWRTFSTFDWFYLFSFPWKLIVVLKNVPWFLQFLPHPLAGLITWQLTCITRSVKSTSTDSFRMDDNVENQGMKQKERTKSRHQAKQESSSEVTRRDLCFCAMSTSQIISGWIFLWSWLNRALAGKSVQLTVPNLPNKAKNNVNVTTNRSHDVRKLQRQNWMFSFPTGFSVGRSYIR